MTKILRILLVIGVSLLAGCGRSDRPTIRQTAVAGDETSPATVPGPPQTAEAADLELEPATARTTRPDLDSGAHPQAAETAHPTSPDATSSKATEANPGAAASAPTSRGAPAPKADASVPPNHSGPTAPANVGTAAPPNIGDPMPPKAAVRNEADAAEADTAEGEVRFGGICLLAPPGWTRERPPVKFILAEFSLPRSQGDSYDAQLTVTLAVKNDPKSLDRLREQLKEEQQSKESDIEHLTIDGHDVILVDSSGNEEEDGDFPPSPAGKGRYRALNAMVFLGGSVYFVNCSGPEKTVTERAGEFRAFLETMTAVE